MKASTPSFVRLAGTAATAELRTESFNGKSQLVVPVVAMVADAVVTGQLSTGPEFVPAHVLAAAPQGFNGRPVVYLHPDDNDGSANSPEQWQRDVFGFVWNAQYSDGRLRAEIWLDREKAEAVGQGALDTLARVEAGEMIEVSIGAWVWQEETAGVSPSGEKFDSQWIAYIADHLAVVELGACSVSRGCGGPRLLTAKQATAIKEEQRMKLLDLLASKADWAALADGMSDSALRGKLNRALNDTVPAFQGVAEVFPDSSTCIYMTSAGGDWAWFEIGYTLEGENVTLGRKKQVAPVTEWKKVAASAGAENTEVIDDTAAGAAATEVVTAPAQLANTPTCQCQHASATKGEAMDKVKELAGKLIALTAAPYAETDREKLEALSEEQLAATLAAFDKPAVEEAKVEEPDPNVVTLTKDEHKRLTGMANREEAREKAHRTALIAQLVAAKCAYTEKQLGAKETEDLELLAQSLSIETDEAPSFLGRGALAVAALAADDEAMQAAAIPTDPWKVAPALAKQLGYKQAS